MEEFALHHRNKSNAVGESVKEYVKHLIFSDVHVPFHNRAALELLFDFIKWFRPDQITINGDLMELYNLSRFPKYLQSLSVEDEFQMTCEEVLVPLRKIFKGQLVFNYGNHEFRMDSYLMTHVKELRGMRGLTVADQLNLSKFNIKVSYSGNRESWYRWGAILIGHWDKSLKLPGAAARELTQQYGQSVIQGHTHKSGETIIRQMDKYIGAYEYGCLCNLDPSWETSPNWVHGFCIVYRKPSKKRYQVTRITIIGGKFVFEGKEFC